MLPRLAQNYARCGGLPNVEQFANLSLRCTVRMEPTNFKNLFHIQLSAKRAMSALFYHICVVILVRAKPKMNWIDTRRIVAFVANKYAVRDRAIMKRVGKAMRQDIFVRLIGENAMPEIMSCAHPFPAIVLATNINKFPESFFDGYACSTRMPSNVRRWASFDMAPSGSRDTGYGGRLTATTHAKAAGVRVWQIVTNAIAMSAHKAVGLAANNAPFAICLFRNLGFLATTTVAVAMRDFLHKKRLLSRTVNALAEGAQPTIEGGHNYNFVRSNRQATASLSTLIIPRYQEVGVCQFSKVGGF